MDCWTGSVALPRLLRKRTWQLHWQQPPNSPASAFEAVNKCQALLGYASVRCRERMGVERMPSAVLLHSCHLVKCFKMSLMTVGHNTCFLMTCVIWDTLERNMVGGHTAVCCRSNSSPQKVRVPNCTYTQKRFVKICASHWAAVETAAELCPVDALWLWCWPKLESSWRAIGDGREGGFVLWSSQQQKRGLRHTMSPKAPTVFHSVLLSMYLCYLCWHMVALLLEQAFSLLHCVLYLCSVSPWLEGPDPRLAEAHLCVCPPKTSV